MAKSTTLKLLIIEDNKHNISIINNTLNSYYQITVLNDAQSAYNYLISIKEMPNIVIANYKIKEHNSCDIIKKIKKRNLNIPFIIYDEKPSINNSVNALKAGAVDYISDLSELYSLYTIINTLINERKIQINNCSSSFKSIIPAELFDLAINKNDTLIWIKDISNNSYLYTSPNFSKLLSKKQEERIVLPDSLFPIIYPEDLAVIKRHLNEQTINNAIDLNCRIIKPDGTKSWINIRIDYYCSDILYNNSYQIGVIKEYNNDALKIENKKKNGNNEIINLKDYFNSLLYGVICIDINGTIISANIASEKIFDITNEMIGSNILFNTKIKFLNEEGEPLELDDNPFIQALKSGQIINNSVIGVSINNTEYSRWVRISAYPVCKPKESKPYQVVISFVDISRQKLLEDKLKYHSAINNAIFEESPISTVFVDLDGYVVDCNKSFVKLFGYSSKNDIVGINIYNQYIKDNFKLSVKYKALNNKYSFLQNYVLHLKNTKDEEIIVEFSVNIVSNNVNKPILYLWLFKDVTSKYKAFEDFKNSEERLRAFFRITGISLLQIDTNKRISKFNPYFSELLGYTYNEIIGKNINDFLILDETDKDNQQSNLNDIIQGNIDSYLIERRYKHKTGKVIWGDTSLTSIKNRKGDVLRILGVFKDITEIKSISHSLKVSQEKMSNILNSISDGFLSLDNQLCISYINSAAEKLLFCSANDILGKYFPERFPEIKTILFDQHSIEIQEKKSFNFEIYIDIDNNQNWYDFRVYPFDDGITIYFRIITETKEYLNKLQESEELYRSLMTASPDAISIIDLDNKICKVSKQKLITYGYDSEEEMIGINCYDLAIQEDYYIMPSKMKELFQKGIVKNVDLRLLRKNGSFFYGQISLALMKDNNNNPIGIVAITRDITEKKNAEAALIHTNMMIETLIQNANVIIISIDKNGKITMYNNEAERITGYKREEIEFVNWFDVISKNQEQNFVRDLFSDSFQKQQLIHQYFETPIITKSGEERIISWHNSEIATEDKNIIIGFITFGIDITENKKAEAKIKELNEKLEYRVEERTKQLIVALSDLEKSNNELKELNQAVANDAAKLLSLNDKLSNSEYLLNELNKELEQKIADRTKELIQAMNKAEEANKLKSIILGNLGHELRTPLNGILGFSHLLFNQMVNSDEKDMIKLIIQSANRLNQTLNSLIALAGLESGEKILLMDILNIAELINSNFYDFDDKIENENIEFSIIINDDEIYSKVDEVLLNQAIYNILDNAVKFTKEGFIKIILNKVIKHDILCSQIIIQDTGIGIPEDGINTIFKAFRQISEGTNRTYEGIGIGLTVTQKIIELMNGSIEVKSKYGEGTSFFIYFPYINKL